MSGFDEFDPADDRLKALLKGAMRGVPAAPRDEFQAILNRAQAKQPQRNRRISGRGFFASLALFAASFSAVVFMAQRQVVPSRAASDDLKDVAEAFEFNSATEATDFGEDYLSLLAENEPSSAR